MAKEIRVHNQGKRSIDYPPKNKGGKPRIILAGRAVTMEAKMAKKYLEAYPRDLIEFDSLVSGEKRDLSKENARLESENEQAKQGIQVLNDQIQKLKDENQWMIDMISELEKELDEATKPVDQEKPDKPNQGEKTDKNKKG